jgi:hypothetical protein
VEVRYFPQGFGQSALLHIGHFSIKSVDESLSDFVTRFGAFIAFTFLEAARPLQNNSAMNIENRNRFLEKWLQGAIPIGEMFNLFLTLYGDDENVKRELNDKTIGKLTESFKKIYPAIYAQLLNARSFTMRKTNVRTIGSNKV